MKCSECGVNDAVVFQRHTGRSLCLKCFEEDLTSRVVNEVKKYNMFSSNSKILLALSGGKDSFALLNLILRIHPASNIGILTIIEGIPGYNRAEDIAWIKEISKKHGIDHHIVTFKEYIGFRLDELVNLSLKSKANISPCTYCGILRRRIMNYVAVELGYEKVVTAHNLDDEVQTIIMDLLRGDIIRLIQLHPLSNVLSEEFIKRVKPLRRIFEYEITQYVYLKGFKFQDRDCPYITTRPTLRSRLRDLLINLEASEPQLLLNIMDWHDRFIKTITGKIDINSLPKLPKCPLCGAPMSYGRKYCSLCELLISIGVLPGNLNSYRPDHSKSPG